MKWLPLAGLYLFWPAMAFVIWGELNPGTSALEAMFWDKALHFLAYFGLSGLLSVAVKADRRILVTTLGLISLGAVLEVVQGFTGRDPSFYDALANSLGAVSGAASGWLLVRLLRPKVLAAVAHN